MTEREAQQIAEAYLNQGYYGTQQAAETTGRLVVMPEHTLTKEYGWIFYYDTQKHSETGELEYALAGNYPLVVEKATGKVSMLDRPHLATLEAALEIFEQSLRGNSA